MADEQQQFDASQDPRSAGADGIQAQETGNSGENEKAAVQVKSADMSDEMRDEAVEVAQEAVRQHKVEKDIAGYIKQKFDSRKGVTWHCIVGRNFGSFVTHETKHFIYMYVGHLAVLLFKTQ